MKEFWKKHYKKVIVLVIIAALGIGIVSCVNKTKKAMETLSQISGNTVETAERRDLVQSVSATGTIVSVDSKTVTSAVTGVEITSVNVKVGDTVAEGDIICVMDSSDLEESLENAKKTLESTEKSTNISLSSAKRGVSETKEEQKIALERIEQQIADNRKDLEEAEKDREKNSDLCKDFYKYKVEEKKNNENINIKYETAKQNGQDVTAILVELNNSNNLLSYYTSQEAAYQAKCDTLDTKIESLKSAYETLLKNKQDTERNYESTLSMKQDTLKSAQNSASISGVNENKQIETYQDQIDNCVVKSPISGVVTSLNVEAGNRYAGSAIAVIENIDSYEISAEIDEYDISKIKLGQKVVIKTNGTGDAKLEGTVVEIAPRASATSANVTYNIRVSVDTANDDLRMDMTAKISIIIEETKQALTVPYTSVQEDDNGFYVQLVCDQSESDTTELLMDGTPVYSRKVYVTKGLESDYYIEILTDEIPEGGEVVVPPDGEVDYTQMGLKIMGGM